MSASTHFHRQLLDYLRQYSHACDLRHLKALSWMVSALIYSGLSLPAWEAYVPKHITRFYLEALFEWLVVHHKQSRVLYQGFQVLLGFFRPSRAQKAQSIERRWRRFLSNQQSRVEALYIPLVLAALSGWQPHRLYLALDTTMLRNRALHDSPVGSVLWTSGAADVARVRA